MEQKDMAEELIKALRHKKPDFIDIKGTMDLLKEANKLREKIRKFKINKEQMELLEEHFKGAPIKALGTTMEQYILKSMKINVLEKCIGIMIVGMPEKGKGIEDKFALLANSLEMMGFMDMLERTIRQIC